MPPTATTSSNPFGAAMDQLQTSNLGCRLVVYQRLDASKKGSSGVYHHCIRESPHIPNLQVKLEGLAAWLWTSECHCTDTDP